MEVLPRKKHPKRFLDLAVVHGRREKSFKMEPIVRRKGVPHAQVEHGGEIWKVRKRSQGQCYLKEVNSIRTTQTEGKKKSPGTEKLGRKLARKARIVNGTENKGYVLA